MEHAPERTQAPPSADPVASPAAQRPPKTTGERQYDIFQFLTGKVYIVVISAVLAYVAKYGPDHYGSVPNYLKQWQSEVKTFFDKKIGTGDNFRGHLSGAATSTTLTMWGGNLFAPVLKALENRKEDIVTYFNKRNGKPGEVEAGHERLKDLPKQNWMDIIKGRFVGWFIVAGSFISAYEIFGKNKTTGVDRFDQYESWFGRKMAGLTQSGKEILKSPLQEGLEEHNAYRFGKIVALDFFATSAAILIWNAISRSSAKKRMAHHALRDEAHAQEIGHPPIALPQPAAAEDPTLREPAKDTAPSREKITARTAEGYAAMARETDMSLPATPGM